MAFELESHFGDEAAREYRAAFRSLHAFAQRTGCKPGGDVIAWFAEQCGVFQDEYRKTFGATSSDRLADERSARAAPNPTSGDQTNG